MRFDTNNSAIQDVMKIWHLGWFMIGFMTMIFSVIIIPFSPHPGWDGLMGLVGVGLVVLNTKYAVQNTPVSLGFFILMFGLAILTLGVYEFVWYGWLAYHTEYWDRFCIAVTSIAVLGVVIAVGGLRFIVKQMKKQGFPPHD